MNRHAPYARPSFKSGGLVRFISKPLPAKSIEPIGLIPSKESPVINGYEVEIQERIQSKKVVELTNKILSCEKELDIPGVYRDGFSTAYKISERYMHTNEFSAHLSTLSIAADNAREVFYDLDDEHPEDSKVFAEAVFGDGALLNPSVYEAAIAVRNTVEALDNFVISHTPVDIDAFRLKILRLSDTISRAMQELRHLQAIGVDIGTAIFR